MTSEASRIASLPSSPPIPRLSAGVRNAGLVIAACSLLALLRLLPVYPHMQLITLATIYIGSHSSVVAHAADSHLSTETMQTRDALLFPLLGSAVLFSLYLVFKIFPKEYVNVVIKAYFFVFGIMVLTGKLAQLLEATLPLELVRRLTSSSFRVRNPLSVWPLTYLASKQEPAAPAATTTTTTTTTTTIVSASTASGAASSSQGHSVAVEDDDEHLSITPLVMVSLCLSLLLGLYYLQSNHWLASNIFGVVFSIQGIELLSLGSYLNGLILLSGLFVYDVFWVFGTEVMVTVAKSFDAPIKLLFPQSSWGLEAGADVDALRPSMLGLGDIVIPGIFIALLLRYDHFRWHKQQQQSAAAVAASGVAVSAKPHIHLHSHALAAAAASSSSSPPSTPYFTTVLLCYFLGLSTTVAVMYQWNAAQPALLYLVPACIGGSLIVALRKGDVMQMFRHVEGETVSEQQPALAAAAEAKKDK